MRLLTTQFRTHQANDFLEYLSDQDIFFFTGQTLPYPDGSPQEIDNTIQSSFYTPMNEMIFGKYVEDDDSTPVIRRIDWVSGEIYDRYDHEEVLTDKKFYVMTREGSNYSIFKCLDNNNNSPSTHRPKLSETDPTDELYQTSDGYFWKLMYTFGDVDYTRFATPNFIPFVANNEVANNSVNGSIDVIDVVNGGSGYENFVDGFITRVNVGGDAKKFYVQSNQNDLSPLEGFYTNSAIYIQSGSASGQLRRIVDYGIEGNNKYVVVDSDFSPNITTSDQFEISPNITLKGDGSGFEGRAIVNTLNKSIERVEVINRGSLYDYAEVEIGANTQAFDSQSYEQAQLRAIIPPYGGHGSNQQEELFGHYICIAESFAGTEAPTANNDYRTFGLLENPVFNEAILVLDSVLGLSPDDLVEQENTSASGTIETIDSGTNTITLKNVSGVFDSTDITSNSTDYSVSTVVKNNFVFDQRKRLDVSFTLGSSFERDEIVIQEETNASGYVHEYSNNSVYLVQTRGEFEISDTKEIIGQNSTSKALINSIEQEDAKKYTGDIYYVENIEPVIRTEDQTESIKLIIGF